MVATGDPASTAADSLSGLLMVPGADFDFGSAASALTFVAAVTSAAASSDSDDSNSEKGFVGKLKKSKLRKGA